MKRALLLFTTLFVVLIAFAGNPFGSDTTFLWIVKAKPMAIDKSQSQMGSLSVLKGEERLSCFYYVDDAIYRKQPIVDTRDEFYDNSRLKSESEICTVQPSVNF